MRWTRLDEDLFGARFLLGNLREDYWNLRIGSRVLNILQLFLTFSKASVILGQNTACSALSRMETTP